MFVNTLCFRLGTEATTLEEVFSSVRTTALGAFDHQEYGFEELVTNLDVPRDMNRNPLFDVMLVFQNQEMLATDNPLYQLDSSLESDAPSKFDLLLNVSEDASGLSVEIT